MGNLLETITTGKAQQPPRIMIYGSEGVGKSTFAASAPKPVFVQTEDGLSEIDCAKFPLCTSFAEVVEQLKAIRDGEHEFQTLCVDSLDWLERLIWDRVCADYGVKSIEKADGGYGKGYTYALTYWREIVKLLNEIRAKKRMAIILVAHAKVERFEDPEHPAYDRYSRTRSIRHTTATSRDSTRAQTRLCASGRTRCCSRPAGCAWTPRPARPRRSVRTAASASSARTARQHATRRTAIRFRARWRSRGRPSWTA